MAVVVSTVVVDPILEFSVHHPFEASYFSGWIESDVHWGYDLDLDPWPYVQLKSKWMLFFRNSKQKAGTSISQNVHLRLAI